ncbi:MAG: class I SAM-dependent methyltransferase [Alphaproteobacteria bacterium]|nr:MAG: class I SAM-dependent methyltransferase [Alphaproteobacteria bacterium]
MATALQQKFEKLYTKRNRGGLRLLPLYLQDWISRITDKEFKKAAGSRYVLLNCIPANSNGAEVGVWKGDFSEKILRFRDPQRLYLIDPWQFDEGIVTIGARHGLPPGINMEKVDDGAGIENIYHYVAKRFANQNNVQIMRHTSVDAAAKIQDASLDWAYIDGDHSYQAVAQDLRAWHPKIKSGGVLCGDDYYWRDAGNELSIKRAVDEFLGTISYRYFFVYRSQFVIGL